MGWAKIEIDLQTEMHDLNEVMVYLAEYFKVDGMPSAVVSLVSTGVSTPEPSSFRSSTLDKTADTIWAQYKGNTGPSSSKILAIKQMRRLTSCSLLDAKDAIDAAAIRNP